MPVLWLIALLISSIMSASAADNAKSHAVPLLEETDDANKAADYIESIPYKPCPSAVRMPSGQLVCLGSPGEPYTWSSRLHSEDRSSPPAAGQSE
jgi:hypothetical protein